MRVQVSDERAYTGILKSFNENGYVKIIHDGTPSGMPTLFPLGGFQFIMKAE